MNNVKRMELVQVVQMLFFYNKQLNKSILSELFNLLLNRWKIYILIELLHWNNNDI